MHILPFQIIHRAFEPAPDEQDSPQMMTARVVVRCLLQQVVASMPFDEEGYLASNPDVATAIRRGEVASAREHYIADGYFEGREGAVETFDEAWYLKRYPDVAHGVKSGQWMSGRHHYRIEGIFEWRSPNQSAEVYVERWRGVLAARPAAARETAEHAQISRE
jgi:hypothetical protein